MNIERILRHAIQVVAQHRALWVLGFIWALVGGAGGGAGQGMQTTFSGGDSNSGTFGSGELPFGDGTMPTVDWAAIMGIALPLLVAACCLVVALIVLTTVVKYVVMVGVLRTLDHLDRFGIEPTVRGAWSEGWNVRTWRPFLQNLIVSIPLAIVFVVALMPVAAPLLLGLIGDGEPIVLGVVAACCLFCCWMLAVIAVSTVISVIQQLWWRAGVLDDLDLFSAMVAGWRLARANVGQLVMVWLVMFVVGILWFVVSITVTIILGMLTAFAAGLPAFLLYQATDSFILPIVVGAPIAIVTFMLPLMFVQGLYLVFDASVWNQVYRELPERELAGLTWADV